jgi:hypothetical protein
LSSMSWLEGSWESVDEKNYLEVWTKQETRLVGKSYQMKKNQWISSKALAIHKDKEVLEYNAIVHNQNKGKAVSFKLKHHGNNKWVFENKNHDFPQRITYFKQTGSFLRIIVDGVVDNQFKKMEWHLKKMDATLIH